MYRYHCENLRKLDQGIKLIQRDLRRYISMEQDESAYIYTRILSHLITCWAEIRVLKLAYERSAFTQDEVQTILSCSSLEHKWITALNIAFCKAYKIGKTGDKDVIIRKLTFTPRSRYIELLDLIQNDLLESIQVRNRVAHGQWCYAFTDDLKEISTDTTAKLRTVNIVNLQLSLKLFRSLSQIIHDLAVSPPTFERDFDVNFRRIEEQTKNLHNRKYQIYKDKMIKKYQRGLARRRQVANS